MARTQNNTGTSRIAWWKDQLIKAVDFISGIIDLKEGINPAEIIAEINVKKSLSGANAWMLMCSIMIASIGLSQDSQAVIIGAMLISPLMSPILGIGLSVGVNDMVSLRGSLAHLGVAIFIALITSSLYFYLTPFNEFTHEIESRTSPTFLDIGIAIFGGVAGIVSISRKDVTTNLPGVAIATALMPPLCVTGYGIATGDFATASKSFYLFFVNTFFVALATYLIVRYLRFPYTQYPDRKSQQRSLMIIGFFALTMLIPSFLIFRRVISELRQKISLNHFEMYCLGDDAIYLDDYYLDSPPNRRKTLYLKVYGEVINESRIDELTSCLNEHGLSSIDIKILSSSEVKIEDIKNIEENVNRIQSELKESLRAKAQIKANLAYAQQFLVDTALVNDLSEELSILYPDIQNIGVGKSQFTSAPSSPECVLLINWKYSANKREIEKIQAFASQRLNQPVRVINYN